VYYPLNKVVATDVLPKKYKNHTMFDQVTADGDATFGSYLTAARSYV